MATPNLTAERVRELLDYDPAIGTFIRKVGRSDQRGRIAGGLSNGGYILISLDNVRYWAHRLAWLHYHGEWPKHHIDHINRNKSDNRICNLRDVPRSINMQNVVARAHSGSGHKNVTVRHSIRQDGSRYTYFAVMIHILGKSIFCGKFGSLDKAIATAEAAQQKYHPGHVVNSRS